MGLMLTVASVLGAGMPDRAEESYLLRVAAAMERCGAGIPAMRDAAETAAARLVAGGRLWAAGQPGMVSELSGRAGGLMMIRPLGDQKPGDGDVVLYFPERDAEVPAWARGGVLVIRFGSCPESAPAPCLPNHAEAFRISPTLANAIPGWLFTGELIAAITRLGKMPVIYESIGLYGGNARIVQYRNGGIAFHDEAPPPVAHGVIGRCYVEAMTAMLRRVDREERDKMARAAAWARESRARGGRLFMYSMGHLFPDEVEKTAIGAVFRSAVWNAGFRASPKPADVFGADDFVALIGYQHPPDDLLRRARPAGARVAYLALYADRDFISDEGVLWIDPMWPWADACVPIEGYDVPLIAASGILNGAIAWELYRLTCGE